MNNISIRQSNTEIQIFCIYNWKFNQNYKCTWNYANDFENKFKNNQLVLTYSKYMSRDYHTKILEQTKIVKHTCKHKITYKNSQKYI